ncbi:MAG: hypothetical protein GY920_04215 [Aliivibrio sp.]|nr:hypothetical protein [Aliivibrio sp.]
MAITFTERYVDATASGGGDGSSGNPWTWNESLTNAVAGDRVNVKVGTYAGDNTTMTADGTRVNPIVFRGYQTTIGDLDDNTDVLVDGTEIPLISGNVNGGGFNTCNYTFINHLSFRTNAVWNVTGWIVILPYGYARRCKFFSGATGSGSSSTRACSTGSTTCFYDCYFSTSSSSSYSIVNGRALHSVGNTFEYAGSGTGWGSGAMTASINVNNTYLRISTALSFSYATYNALVSGCTFQKCGTAITTSNAGYDRTRTITNCYFADCGTGIQSVLSDNSGFHIINCGFYNNTNNIGSNIPEAMLVNPKYDTDDPFVDSTNKDFRLKSTSLGYGLAFPKKSYMSSELNGRDVGSLQHVDPTLTRTKHPLARI